MCPIRPDFLPCTAESDSDTLYEEHFVFGPALAVGQFAISQPHRALLTAPHSPGRSGCRES